MAGHGYGAVVVAVRRALEAFRLVPSSIRLPDVRQRLALFGHQD